MAALFLENIMPSEINLCRFTSFYLNGGRKYIVLKIILVRNVLLREIIRSISVPVSMSYVIFKT